MAAVPSIVLYFYFLIIPTNNVLTDTTLVEFYTIGEFQRATRVVVNAQGVVYVIDADQNKLFRFVNANDPPASIGGFGWSATSFDKPTGIATDGINIYISDYGNHRIQRFDRNLNFISSFQTRDTTEASVRFGYPVDVALSELGDLFVLDGENVRALKFSPSYRFECSFGDIDAKGGRLHNPVKLVVSSSRVFIGERSRIVVFDYFGNFLGSIGEGLISELSGFTISGDCIIAGSSDTLWWFTLDGSVQKKIPLKEILTSDRIDRIQDIASHGNQLLLLSSHKLYVCKISE